MSVTLVRPGLRKRLLEGCEPEWLKKHIRRGYIIQVCMSAPPWIGRADFTPLQQRAAWLTRATGHKHVLDHIIPVTHPLVCGLTVPWNMQVIDSLRNQRKSNKLHLSFQAELFAEPEQLRLIA